MPLHLAESKSVPASGTHQPVSRGGSTSTAPLAAVRAMAHRGANIGGNTRSKRRGVARPLASGNIDTSRRYRVHSFDDDDACVVFHTSAVARETFQLKHLVDRIITARALSRSTDFVNRLTVLVIICCFAIDLTNKWSHLPSVSNEQS